MLSLTGSALSCRCTTRRWSWDRRD